MWVKSMPPVPLPPCPLAGSSSAGAGVGTSPTPLQVLALPSLVWKQLSGEEVIWSKDFAAVDVELVSRVGTVPVLPWLPAALL